MRILQVIHQFPKSHGAGSENYTKQICQILKKNNHTVVVLTMGEKFFNGPYGVLQKISGYPFPVFAYFQHPRNSDSPVKEYWNPSFDAAFSSFITEWKPDIIHFQHALQLSISLVSIACETGIPVLFTLHDFWTVCPNIVMLDQHNKPCQKTNTPDACRLCMTVKFKAPRIFLSGNNLYKKRRERMITALNQCKQILCPSHTLLNSVQNAGVKADKLLHWPFGIDISPQSKVTSSKKIHQSEYPIRFGYTGTLASQKGVDILLKAYSNLSSDLLSKSELYIYGNPLSDSKTNRRVQKWIKRFSHPAIRFMGPYSADEIEAVQNNIDVVVVPSTWYENRPLTVLEAYASGNPVLGSNIGGIAELIEQSNAGWTFPSGDVKSLENILRMLITEPSQIKLKQSLIPVIPDIRTEVSNLTKLYKKYKDQD